MTHEHCYSVHASIRALEDSKKKKKEQRRIVYDRQCGNNKKEKKEKKKTKKENWGEKMYGYLKRKGNLKRETESLLMTAQNIAMRTNYIELKIDNTQQNIYCTLCGN